MELNDLFGTIHVAASGLHASRGLKRSRGGGEAASVPLVWYRRYLHLGKSLVFVNVSRQMT